MGTSNSLLADVISESLSKNHYTVIQKLSKPKHDEDIAAELKIKATVVRTLLNDLHLKSLVEYERSKNKKTGWYTYVWKKREDKIDSYVQSYLHERLEVLGQQLDDEKQGVRFKCNCDGGKRVTLDEAMEADFTCPDCSGMFIESSSKEIVKKLEIEIKKFQKRSK